MFGLVQMPGGWGGVRRIASKWLKRLGLRANFVRAMRCK